ncbi:12S rRNA N4-methylcytidine (m4C) methyltransferase isoform X5 [Falco rusticolus]|uniref:12S rRNA N4-methylcytidine (m4C) methyltransferase isoform X5 n=1 Tax=Falco rusticolus TaxID=120794 RepID=UPI001886A0E6|nr:12S rRNA N4-methylcytidine (m4C) methyltransferase isoform X5 [Falco rusticolus]XP_055577675.1 12S rRNA N4-methylcytidine (m4C) methyltransferase isoform X5 [Falco cherrug]
MFGKTEGNSLKVKSLFCLCSDLGSYLRLAALGHCNTVKRVLAMKRKRRCSLRKESHCCLKMIDWLINSKMLSKYLCQVYKCLFLHNLKLNSVNVSTLARRIHSSAKKLSDCELNEQIIQKRENKEFPQSTENGNFGRLHIPVMLEEVVNCLSPQPGQRFLDMTFGAGGHTTALLEKASGVTVYALDRDPTAYKIAQQLSELYPKQIQPLLGQFSQAEALLISSGVEPGTLDGVLLDAGCSSMQFDTPERGFSLQKDGPLDMRMDSDRSTGACVHPENIRGGEARQENRFSHRSGTQHIPHHQNSAACKHCCRCFSSISTVCTQRLASKTYTCCYQNFSGPANICK